MEENILELRLIIFSPGNIISSLAAIKVMGVLIPFASALL